MTEVTNKPNVFLVSTHPIQYQIPWFQALAIESEIEFSVLFVQRPDAKDQGVGFGLSFEWDIPLYEGYQWQQVQQLRGRKGLRGFFASRIASPVKLLRDLKPTVLVLTGWQAWPLIQLLLAARLLKIPVIMRGESNALRQRPLGVRLLHRLLLRQCAAFLTIGKSNGDFYRNNGVPESKLFNAAYFVDNARFQQASRDLAPEHSAIRNKWRIPDTAICFCYVGKLEPKKRVLDVLSALHKALERSESSMCLLIVGSGELMDEAVAFVERLSLPVTFAGFLNQTEIPAAYVASDCLVLASDYGETWGLVVNEAMACGRSAIVSNRAGCSVDLVIEGETGLTFPFGDVDALADRLVQVAADPIGLKEMGVKARERVSEHYSIRNAVQGTLSAIRSVHETA